MRIIHRIAALLSAVGTSIPRMTVTLGDGPEFTRCSAVGRRPFAQLPRRRNPFRNILCKQMASTGALRRSPARAALERLIAQLDRSFWRGDQEVLRRRAGDHRRLLRQGIALTAPAQLVFELLDR